MQRSEKRGCIYPTICYTRETLTEGNKMENKQLEEMIEKAKKIFVWVRVYRSREGTYMQVNKKAFKDSLWSNEPADDKEDISCHVDMKLFYFVRGVYKA